jgi:type IV pilus assembly protein PilQ
MEVPFPRGLAAFAAAFAPIMFATPSVASSAVIPVAAVQATPAMQDTAGSAQQQQSPGNQTVSFDVKDRDLSEIVDFIRKRADVNIVLAPTIQEKVTLTLKDVDWRQALDLVAERAGCVVVHVAPNLIRIEKPPRVHFAFQNVEIREVIDAIAKIGSANVVVAPEVKGSITIRLKDVPWRDALETAVKTLNYTVVQEERGILRVVEPKSLELQLETKAFQLKYIRPMSIYQPKIETAYTEGKPKIVTDPVKEFRILDALRKVLTKNGKLDYIDRVNAIVVTDIPPVIRQIERMLAEFDVEPKQVFIDVKFVSTVNTDAFDFGVDYGSQGPVVTASGSQIPIELPFQLGKGGFEDDIIVTNTINSGPFSQSGTVPGTNAGTTNVPSTIFGALSFTQVSAALRILKRDVRSEIQQSPRIICLDNHTATIFVGEQVPYAQARTEQGQAGGLLLSVEEADKSPVQTGFQLLVTPHIVPGKDRMILEIIPKQQALSGSGGPPLAPAGFDVFTVGGSGLVGSIALPRVAASTIATTMLLENGQTAVLGGLTTDSKSETVTKIPLLGDIPILGWLFKSVSSFNDRRTLIVLVTPTVVRSSEETSDEIDKELDRQQRHMEKELDRLFGKAEPKEGAAETAPNH